MPVEGEFRCQENEEQLQRDGSFWDSGVLLGNLDQSLRDPVLLLPDRYCPNSRQDLKFDLNFFVYNLVLEFQTQSSIFMTLHSRTKI